jgi:hypothetical protein
MSLARIAPGSKGFDIRTFECTKCESIYIVTVSTDPMKSEEAGWIPGDLKAPM